MKSIYGGIYLLRIIFIYMFVHVDEISIGKKIIVLSIEKCLDLKGYIANLDGVWLYCHFALSVQKRDMASC